jgi:hypothetical protein
MLALVLSACAARCIALVSALALTGTPVAWASSPSSAVGEARNPTAVAAYEDALELVRTRDYDEAIAKLDEASELEPTWSDPVRVRADAFGELAARHKPSAVFTAARADELERLVVLEPGVDAAARKHEIATLRQRSKSAEVKEQRRRKLMAPAAVFITLSAGFMLAGVLLHSMKPTREALQPGAYRQERRDRAGITLMVAGGALAPVAITLGVLAFRQAKRDSRVRDYEVTTRRRSSLAIAPQLLRRGGGLAMAMRF